MQLGYTELFGNSWWESECVDMVAQVEGTVYIRLPKVQESKHMGAETSLFFTISNAHFILVSGSPVLMNSFLGPTGQYWCV